MKHDIEFTTDMDKLVEESLPLIHWTIHSFIHCREDIAGLAYDDLVQEGCIALCSAASSYQQGRGSFQTYAVTVIRNHLIDYCRDIMARENRLPTVSLDHLTDNGWEADNGQSTPDMISQWDVCRFLCERKRRYTGTAKLGVEALLLKITDGYGVTDIAELYGVKPNQVGAWISKAKKRILMDLTQEELETFGKKAS